MVPGLNCLVACGIFPDQGSNPCPLNWQVDSDPLYHQGSPKWSAFIPDWMKRDAIERYDEVRASQVALVVKNLLPM